jgi:hypothetical protein
LLGGFAWINPRRVLLPIRAARRAAQRAYAFHNPAISAVSSFEGFSEEKFWDGVEEIQRKNPEALAPYRVIFERCLHGEVTNITAPDGVGQPQSARHSSISAATQH